MYKRTGPVNKETQDDVARRSDPCCFRAEEEFRVRLEAAGAHPRHQRRLGRHNPAAGRTRSIQGRGSASTTARTRSIRVGRTTPARRIFRFMPKYYADGDKACDRASLVTSKLAHDRQVQICKKHRIRRPNQRNVVLSWQAFPSTDNFSRSMLVASAVAADGRESKRCWPGSCFDRVVLT
jgi:hypothetical protein